MIKKTIFILIIQLIFNCSGIEKTEYYKINKNLIIKHKQEKISHNKKKDGYFAMFTKDQQIGELTYSVIKKTLLYPFGHNVIHFHINKLQINKAYQKNGYGGILINLACKKFIENRATKITLYATPLESNNNDYEQDLYRLFKFYKKHGFDHIENYSKDMICKIKQQQIVSKL